jgi:hypothetical protein
VKKNHSNIISSFLVPIAGFLKTLHYKLKGKQCSAKFICRAGEGFPENTTPSN